MDGIKIEVSGNIAKVTQKPQRITAGTVGMPVEFTFDDQWDGLDRIAVFQAGRVRKNMVLVENATAVPMEVLATPGPRLNIGVYGVNKDGSVAIPTLWANAGQIREGATPADGAGIDIGIAKKYYDKAMLAAADAESAARRAVDAADSLDITYFGEPYTSAVEIIPLDEDEFVNMYLFATVNGYDAVVTGEGQMRDYPWHYDNNYNFTVDFSDRNYDAGKISRLHIDKNVTYIGDCFMLEAYNLKHLSFADEAAITHLGAHSFALTQIDGFYKFTGLEQETFDGVFRCCRKLDGLTLSNNVKEIGYRTFYQCTDLQYVDGITGVTSIAMSAFQHCHKLEHLDVVPENITLSDFAFMLSSVDAKVKDTDTLLSGAKWRSSDCKVPFVPNEWNVDGVDYLQSIRDVRPKSTRMPIPEMDTQNSYPYDSMDWTPILHPYGGFVFKNKVLGGCFLFSLYHIYNILHPDMAYATFYDFVTRGIMPRKITVTAELHNALNASEVWDGLQTYHTTNATGITYEEGTEINAFDLPLVLDYDQIDYSSEGTLFWGICYVLGWGDSTEYNLSDATKGAEYKRMVIEEMDAGRPVIMEIVGAGYTGHGAHAVVPIGYDNDTDKFLIIDSASALPTDDVPFVYWIPFEAMITPNQASSIRTFENFGEEITMTTIDENLKTLLQAVNSGFRMVNGHGWDYNGTNRVSIPCPPKPKLVIFKASDDTAAAVLAKASADSSGAVYPFGAVLQDLKDFDTQSIFNASNQNSLLMCYQYFAGYGAAPVGKDTLFTDIDTVPKFSVNNFLTEYTKDGKTVPAEYNWTAYYWNE